MPVGCIPENTVTGREGEETVLDRRTRTRLGTKNARWRRIAHKSIPVISTQWRARQPATALANYFSSTATPLTLLAAFSRLDTSLTQGIETSLLIYV
jgi:hypothetical protein